MSERHESATRDGGLWTGILGIVLVGAALGLIFNALGQQSRPARGLAWIAEDPLERLASMETVRAQPGSGTADPDAYVTTSTDPLAVPATAAAAANLPPIPDVGRPVQIEIGALKQYWDAGAAVIADAREPYEFEESHIAGAISLPYDRAVSDPALVETLDTGGRPIIVYCGGGACELSIKLADELVYAGHPRVAVYMGGFPEWVEAGYPTGAGAAEPGRAVSGDAAGGEAS